MTSYPREMLKAGAAVICRCEGPHGIAMTHAEITAAVLDATLGLSQAELDIITERRRQITEEGWTAEHDDEHGNAEMARAGAAYALGQRELGGAVQNGKHFAPWRHTIWPWDIKWFKPSDPRRNLIKAGALIQAEIERLDRAAAKDTASTPEPTP